MTSNSTVVSLRQPDTVDDPLTAVLRSGAHRLLAQAIEAEADAFLATMKGLQLSDGRDRMVRHGHGPERQMQTGIGPVSVQRVRLRDRGADDAGERTLHVGYSAAVGGVAQSFRWPARPMEGRASGSHQIGMVSAISPESALAVSAAAPYTNPLRL